MAEAAVQHETSRLGMLQHRFESTSARADVYEASVLPLVEQQIADVERLMELGSVDSLLVLDAVSRVRAAKERLLAFHAESLRIQNAMVELVGPAPVAEASAGVSK